MAETKSVETKKSVKRSWPRRWIRRLGVAIVVGYVACAALLYFEQTGIVFPGSKTQGKPEARVVPRGGEELVLLRTGSGEKVTALYSAATDAMGNVLADAEQRPTILFFYGNGGCLSRARNDVTRFRALGVNVLTPEFVGYGLSSGRPSRKGVLETANASYDYLTEVRQVEAGRLVVVGKSLGGAPAIYLASSRPIGAVATFSTFTSLHEVAQHAVRYFPTSLLLKDDFDNERLMHRVHCPVFVAHGAKDDFVPFAMANLLAHAVDRKACGNPVCVDIANASHTDLFSRGGAMLMGQFDLFVKSAIGPMDAR